MNYNEFKSKVMGHGYDVDGWYGFQCWDGYAYYCMNLGIPYAMCNMSGYVKDIWNARWTNGTLKYFDEVSVMEPGDIVVFQEVAGITPWSHIAIFDSDAGNGWGNFLGQNQGGPNGVFNIARLPYSATFPTAFRLKNKPAPSPQKIGYQAHVQNEGWQKPVFDGMTAGTTGKSLRMEALRIFTQDGTVINNVSVYVEKEGWKTFKNPGKDAVLGTTGKSLRMEAIKIKASRSVKFRVHIQDKGWTKWFNADGAEVAGKEKSGKRIEAIEIKRV